MIDVALIGCGEHSLENLIPSLTACEQARVVAVCDSSPQAMRRARNFFPDATLAKDFREAIAGDCSSVVVAATPEIHALAAHAALALGKSVFVEKPPTRTTKELIALSNLAKERNIVTGVGHNLRHSNAAIQMQSMSSSTDFGKLVAMEMRYMASKPRGDRWNLGSPLRSFLLSHANHAIDLMLYHMGPIALITTARAWPEIDGGVAMTAGFVFESGAVGNLLATSYAPHFTVSASILSNKGGLVEMNGLHEVKECGHPGDPKRLGRHWVPRTLETGYRHAGYHTELEAFFRAVGERNPAAFHPSFADEVAIYEAIDQIEDYLSIDNVTL